jgi:hypothetical protein
MPKSYNINRAGQTFESYLESKRKEVGGKLEKSRQKAEERIRRQIEREDLAERHRRINWLHNAITAAKRKGEPTGELEASLQSLITKS